MCVKKQLKSVQTSHLKLLKSPYKDKKDNKTNQNCREFVCCQANHSKQSPRAVA